MKNKEQGKNYKEKDNFMKEGDRKEDTWTGN